MMTGAAGVPDIPVLVRLRVVLRSAWVQSTLNYETMQGLGALFCLVPVARWLRLSGTEWSAFVRRHTGVFNSNPFISPLGLGALARWEFDRLDTGLPGYDDHGTATFRQATEILRLRLSTPLGAVGDGLFWAAVRPQMVLLGSLWALIAGWWGALVLVAGFAVWQWSFRWRTFGWGWSLGTGVAAALTDRRLREPARIAGLAAAATAGMIGVAALAHGYPALVGHAVDAGVALVFVGAALAAGWLTRRNRAETWGLVVGMAWAILAGAVGTLSGLW